MQFNYNNIECGSTYWIRDCSADCGYKFDYHIPGQVRKTETFLHVDCNAGEWNVGDLRYKTSKSSVNKHCADIVHVKCNSDECDNTYFYLECVDENIVKLAVFKHREKCDILLNMGYADVNIARTYYKSFSFKVGG